MSEERSVTVHVASNELEAQAVSHLLEQAEIPHVVVSNTSAAGYTINIGKFAQVPIRVMEARAEEARQLIADWQKSGNPAEETE